MRSLLAPSGSIDTHIATSRIGSREASEVRE